MIHLIFWTIAATLTLYYLKWAKGLRTNPERVRNSKIYEPLYIVGIIAGIVGTVMFFASSIELLWMPTLILTMLLVVLQYPLYLEKTNKNQQRNCTKNTYYNLK